MQTSTKFNNNDKTNLINFLNLFFNLDGCYILLNFKKVDRLKNKEVLNPLLKKILKFEDHSDILNLNAILQEDKIF